MDEAKPAESSGSSAESPDVRKIEVRRISKDHVANDSIPGEQDSDLPPELSGECRKVLGQFRRNDLMRSDTPPECPFQSAALGLLYSENVTVYCLDGSRPLRFR